MDLNMLVRLLVIGIVSVRVSPRAWDGDGSTHGKLPPPLLPTFMKRPKLMICPSACNNWGVDIFFDLEKNT